MIKVLDLDNRWREHSKGTGFRFDYNILVVLDDKHLPIAAYAVNEWKQVIKIDD